MSIYDKYETIIGLEIHAQLATQTKAFSSDPNLYDSLPNHNVSCISLGHPGTLPQLNTKSITYAIRMGIACKAKITKYNKFSRKNYFYPDLPKGYQITQFDTPICTGGYIKIQKNDGEKVIELTRIHIEEDSGKSIHDLDPFNTLIDLNRAGVPLIEIVSEPQLRSGEEAYLYLVEIRKLLRYLEICDGNMEEGSMRCDANISVRKKGITKFGKRVEVKNMNSLRNVQRAIDYETKRQIDAIENGNIIRQETRTFNAIDGLTSIMREKEEANDYRYFTEPDLLPLIVTPSIIDEINKNLPALPEELYSKYTSSLKLNNYDAKNLIENKNIALYFEEIIQHTQNYKAAANWVMGSIKSYLNEYGITIEKFPLKPKFIAEIIELIQEGKISNTIATNQLFLLCVNNPNTSPAELAKQHNIIQQRDSNTIIEFIKQVIQQNPNEVERFKNGETKLIGFFMGQVMKLSKGKADPKKATELIAKMLNEE